MLNKTILNHFCLRKAHIKGSIATEMFRRQQIIMGVFVQAQWKQIAYDTGEIVAAASQRESVIFGAHKSQELWKRVRGGFFFPFSFFAPAAEGDLNMHSSKGFYTNILVIEESHPVTAL